MINNWIKSIAAALMVIWATPTLAVHGGQREIVREYIVHISQDEETARKSYHVSDKGVCLREGLLKIYLYGNEGIIETVYDKPIRLSGTDVAAEICMDLPPDIQGAYLQIKLVSLSDENKDIIEEIVFELD